MNFGKGDWQTFRDGIKREWVITNGSGSYAGSSIIGAQTRKHHGLLIASLHAPINRMLILSKINEQITLNNTSTNVEIDSQTFDFSTNQRRGGFHEEGQRYLQRFSYDLLPTFTYYVNGTLLKKTIALDYEKNTVAIGYEIKSGPLGGSLNLTPLFNYREHGGNTNPEDLCFDTTSFERKITLVPEKNEEISISFLTSEGLITPRTNLFDEPIELQTEIDTGMDSLDYNYTPYDISIDFSPNELKRISIVCSIEETYNSDAFSIIEEQENRISKTIEQAGVCDSFSRKLVQASDWFITNRSSTGKKTILAGLPWFTDWGRDTMIAMQGLTLNTKRYEDAKEILQTFAAYVKNGLVPNMFPDEGEEPLYNTVDASLWYFYSVDKYLSYTGSEDDYQFIKEEIYPKLEEIISFYKKGTDFSIHMDEDFLICAGSGVDQVTWMDVRVGDWVVTPRHGKPVEINALWYNALKVMEKLSRHFGLSSKEYAELSEKVKTSFTNKFWNERTNCLYDVVPDVSSKETSDGSIRPNQIWAVSLPYTMLSDEQAKNVVDVVYTHLYAGTGLRSLSPWDKDYHGEYYGSLHKRDGAYHQGTSWGFPLGGFITAYVKVYGTAPDTIAFAKELLAPVEDHLRDGCIFGIAEIFDGDSPHRPRGCYAQAWSVGEILRCYTEDILPYLK